ncbi:serine hydrolase [Pseudarthrobacter sp. O4]|uniref:serine hydrolase n=1 Tax=Pseudarthrobacter sp. O4 TaxID=3418417 RepID=UPI003CF09950
MDSTEPRRHYRSARRSEGEESPAPGYFRRLRPRVLTAAAAALALIAATAVYVSIQSSVPADAVARPETSVTAAPGTPGTASAATNEAATAKQAPSAPASAAAPSPAPAAEAPVSPAAPPDVEAPSVEAPSAGEPPLVVEAPDRGPLPFSPAFDAPINAIIEANSRYQVGVALINVKDGVVHEYGDKTKFVAASTAKILAAAAYYHLVETDRASLTARMGSSTAAVQIRQMVQQSNNDSWALILGAVGNQGMTAYAASLGISYDRTVNLLSPAETGKTLSLLYSGQLLNPQHTAQLLSYMQHTNYETLIPAAVPPGINVFHKYGLLFGNLHDASILVQGDRAYVFVVYTLGKNTSDMAARTRIIHELTQAVTAGLF